MSIFAQHAVNLGTQADQDRKPVFIELQADDETGEHVGKALFEHVAVLDGMVFWENVSFPRLIVLLESVQDIDHCGCAVIMTLRRHISTSRMSFLIIYRARKKLPCIIN